MFKRRALLKAGGVAGASFVAFPMINIGKHALFAASPVSYSTRIVDLVQESLVVDMLSLFVDLSRVFSLYDNGADPFRLSVQEIRDFKKTGINVFHPAIGFSGPESYEAVLSYFSGYNGLAAQYSNDIGRVTSIADFEHIKAAGKTGFILGNQNTDHFRTIDDVAFFYHQGQRISQLTYNSQNLVGSGATERVDGGVSDYGVEVIKAMNDVGMAIDVSHCGDRTTLDAFELSDKPVLITHSNARALTKDHPRCKSDEAIKKMAVSGGVMGVSAVRNFVTRSEPTTIEHYVDHIDYIASLVGIEHVGVGTDADLNGYDDLPSHMNRAMRKGYKSSYGFREKMDIEGLDHPQKIFDLTDALVRRGYSAEHIRMILGGNCLRALGQIWKN